MPGVEKPHMCADAALGLVPNAGVLLLLDQSITAPAYASVVLNRSSVRTFEPLLDLISYLS